MNNKWKHCRSITKYNPSFRNEKGHYMKDDWIGFGQIGGVYEGELLTLDSYLQIESKYIKAAYDFFAFHKTIFNSLAFLNQLTVSNKTLVWLS